LHHSSLGSLFLVTPQRLHALWYTPWLPLFFIISAMGGGLMFAVFAKILWSWWYDRELVFGKTNMRNIPLLKKANGIEKLTRHSEGEHFPIVRQLASIAAGVLAVYFAFKIMDLSIQGTWGTLLEGTWESWLYIFELVITSMIPVTLMLIPQTRRSPAIIGFVALSGALGLALNRVNVGIFGYFRDAGIAYFPSLAEWAVCLGVIAASGLVFLFIAENLQIFNENPPAVQSRAGIFRHNFGTLRQIWHMVFMDSLHRVSLIAVITLPLAFALMYPPFFTNSEPNTIIKPSIGVDAERSVLKIDGNRNNIATEFAHLEHQQRMGGELSCNKCHHISMPNDKSTPCFECHRYMNKSTVIFDHDAHRSYIAKKENLRGMYASNKSCTKCHPKNSPKSAKNAINCLECHKQNMFLNAEENEDINLLKANPFREAMHSTCIDCHREVMKSEGKDMLDNCGTCHLTLKARNTEWQGLASNDGMH